MRKLMLLGVLLALACGCKKPAVNVAANNQPQPQPAPQGQPNQPNQPAIHPPGNVVINPNQGGGGGGAAQAVRKRVKRAVSEHNLNQLRTYIETMIVDERMPTREQLAASLSKEAPNLYKDWTDGVIEVTGTARPDGVWAYTVEPQTSSDEHLVVTRSNAVGRMKKDELNQALGGK